MISRFGIFAEKLGMSRLPLENKFVAVTLLRVPEIKVLNKREEETHFVLTLGISQVSGRVKKAQAKEQEKLGSNPCKIVKEFKVAKGEEKEVGDIIKMEWLSCGCIVDVSSKSIGKGFAGVMKRWNFSGLKASHGVSLTHRSAGSTGTREKIYKGKKMAGRMGNELVTVQNQKVVFIDVDMDIFGVAGSVPGKKGTWVKICKAVKGFGV